MLCQKSQYYGLFTTCVTPVTVEERDAAVSETDKVFASIRASLREIGKNFPNLFQEPSGLNEFSPLLKGRER